MSQKLTIVSSGSLGNHHLKKQPFQYSKELITRILEFGDLKRHGSVDQI